ncbi:hypothetical protein NW759_000838 [Fusarium solani]|nr:hypothetical protein NW759_000838 [Fusarium solani]
MEPTLKQTRETTGKATRFEHTQEASSPPSNERHQTQIYQRVNMLIVPRHSGPLGCLGPLTESGCFSGRQPWFSLEPLNHNYLILGPRVDGRMTADVSGGIRYSLPCRPRGR